MKARLGSLFGLVLVGCPPDPPAGDCSGQGDPELVVSRRQDDAPPLVDGAELDVFPPPQGGVFTELDVVLVGLAADDVEMMQVDIVRRADGTPLSAQRYQGGALSAVYFCQPDDTLLLQNMPVGFMEAVNLDELDGVEVTMSVVAVTAAGEVRFEVDLVLAVTAF